MATKTQYDPNFDLNKALLSAGGSKTVYALVNPYIESVKDHLFGDNKSYNRSDYYGMFHDAWTNKQQHNHEVFFKEWVKWSSPVVDISREIFPFAYPTAGASEAIRQIIFDAATVGYSNSTIHVFEGEYEGYRAMAEAANLGFMAHSRDLFDPIMGLPSSLKNGFNKHDLFFLSAPSAIDGNVWGDFNAFLAAMPECSVVVDATYVGSTAPVDDRFKLNSPSVAAVVFSLSKPFGAYYDRIGGVLMRQESLALFGNQWFKNLTSIELGIELMRSYDVHFMNSQYAWKQKQVTITVGDQLGLFLEPSDVFLIATGPKQKGEIGEYLLRGGKTRICITPALAKHV